MKEKVPPKKTHLQQQTAAPVSPEGVLDNLVAPQIEGLIKPDNLVPMELLNTALQISIPQWPRVLANDTVIVYLNSNISRLDPYVIKDPKTEKFPIQLAFPGRFLSEDGTFSIHYEVTADSGVTAASDAIEITVNRQPPISGNTPEALVFPGEVVENGITLEYLAAHDNQVIATVPGYQGMEAGEVVHLIWDNKLQEPVTITAENVENNNVTIAISQALIEETGEGSAAAYYFLTSRAGYDGNPSDPTVVNIILTPAPANLKAPEIPLADDKLIDLEDADAGVTLKISEYDNARTGDRIVAKWGDSFLAPITMVEGAFPVIVDVPRRIVIAGGTGSIKVSYQVNRDDKNYASPVTSVEVNVDYVGPVNPDPDNPVNEALSAPTVKGSSDTENTLLPADKGNAVTVTVPFYEEAKVGEIVTVFWGEGENHTSLDPHTVVQDDITNKKFPDFTVPAAVVDATPNDPKWPVYYTLSRATEPANPVLSPDQLVNVFLTGPEDLVAAEFLDINERGWLLRESVVNGCHVLVAVYKNMAVGDQVKLTWQAFSTTNNAPGTEIENTLYQQTKTVGAPEMANGVAFTIPFAGYIDGIIDAVETAQGSASVNYTVTQSGLDFEGDPANVKIDLGVPY